MNLCLTLEKREFYKKEMNFLCLIFQQNEILILLDQIKIFNQ